MPVKPKIILSLAQHRKMDVVKIAFTDYHALGSPFNKTAFNKVFAPVATIVRMAPKISTHQRS